MFDGTFANEIGMALSPQWMVYCLHDDSCNSPWLHGWVGVTSCLKRRLYAHRRSRRLPAGFQVKMLLEASKAECLAYAAELRPRPGIGWNRGRGGFTDGRGLRGVAKSPEHREKIRQAALRRYSDHSERKRTQQAVKKAFEAIRRDGKHNAMSGRHHSEETKRKISIARRHY
ncbi:NUMOD3 domain-containing DNA-binding protein [Bradyrhizobium sp. CCGUVB1N3]|uniref:NUMOD3 domain-containing DNA-binding protein n=1 Tax=Bradyrhizobium sp. CCGUVB1N3 TaxID=2949629 RepID=UPI0020B2E23A|nr:NUMOD3 domain-containing DNA-binding protein [Bradyrhizobium sp. CCGUVB1N3]MCP3471421.1 NUMOD3 domain-containing DNA-binding protein [Bradyrhizobium sp. CCGUVB1N3]MCP3472361.1 NUMOD3 domain-containing DNA-binding protein [Bradyrhizobium sp. CCGUVB1N3]